MRLIFFGVAIFFVSSIYAQVNLQNGSANYAIPIFSFSDAKSGLSTGVSLSYSSGNGLVVNNQASNIGQNWSLSAGGAIVRKQNGEPDDQNSTSLFPTYPYSQSYGYNKTIAAWAIEGTPEEEEFAHNYINNYYPNGYLYSEFPNVFYEQGLESFAIPKELAFMPRFRNNYDKRWKLSRRALADKEQDIFIYSFNGVSGEFVLGKDGNPLLLNDSKIIITKSTNNLTGLGIRTRIHEFIIKDVNGIIYKFSDYELAEVMKLTQISSEGPDAFKKVVTSGEPTGNYTIQKWILTEIINPITQEKVIFEYDNYSIDVITDKIPSYQNVEGQNVESVQIYEQRSRGQLKRLKNILLPDGHKIEFSYNTQVNRIDVPGDYVLSQVKILYNAEEVNTFTLNHGYFLKKEIKNYTDVISESDKRFTRLSLNSVQKSGRGLNEPAYKFGYFTGIESTDPKDMVPPYDCVAQDHWGFYNKSSIVDNNVVSPYKEVLRNLMLNASSYREPLPGAAVFGLLKSVETPFGGKLLFEYEQNESRDTDNPLLTKTAGGVRVLNITSTDGISSANNIVSTYNYKLSDGSTSGWGYETPAYQNRRQIKIWNAGSADGFTKEGILKTDITNSLTKFFVKEAAKKLFKAFIGKATIASMGANPAAAIAAMIIGGLIDRLFELFNPTDYVWSNTYGFYSYQSQNSIGINYSRVEVVNTSIPGGAGKVISEFTRPVNVRSEIPLLTLPYSSKERFASWKYGLPSKTVIVNQSGSTVKEIINNYNVVVNSNVSENHKSTKVEVGMPHSAAVYAATYNIPVSDFIWEDYYPISGRAELASLIEKNYNSTGTLSQSEASTTYNNDYLPKSSSTTKSNGDIIISKTYYTNDYNNISTAIQEMKIRNMLAVPISTETWLTKPGGAEYLLDATINEFNVLPNGEIKIKKIYKLETKQPLLKSLIGEQSPTILVRNSTYFKEQVNFNYDANGNSTETTTPEGKISSKIYDHNKRYVTAEVSNALQSEFAYTSFETSEKGGWIYGDGGTVIGDAVTGKKYTHFSSFELPFFKRVVNSSKAYTLSFWAKGLGVGVTNNSSNVLPTKTVSLTLNGWTYYEYSINNPGTVIITRGYGAIDESQPLSFDELRIYPKDARMSTIAYDPKIGKITECDVNNRLLYYQYDGLGRLKIVRDDRKNIIKMLCYNYAGEVENCASSLAPNWVATGSIRCKPCAANPIYFTNILQREEKDLNQLSDTYNQLQWIDYSTDYSCQNNSWQSTGNTNCNLDYNNQNNGYQEVEQINVNPCSSYYNTTNWIIVYNPSACPVGGGGGNDCNGTSCNGDDKKCINGVCETGTWTVVSGTVAMVNGVKQWTCTWKYCFSDGSHSTYSQVVTGSSPCLITCY